MSISPNISIQPLSPEQIESALDLSQRAGWNQTWSDWQRLICFEPDGCFAATYNRQLVGTVTTTRYGRQLSWIGMMLIHPDFRRRGIATRLMEQAVDYLNDHDVQCIKLDATADGRMVYNRLGFNEEWHFQRWQRASEKRGKPLKMPVTRLPLSELALEVDRIAFGVDRGALLSLMSAQSIVHQNQTAYGMLRPGHLAVYLGPLCAATPSSAKSILAALCGEIEGSIFWDIPSPNGEALGLAQSLGFRPVRDLIRMYLGEDCSPGNLTWQYALADPGTG